MSLSWWQGLVNREKLKVKSSSPRRHGRRRHESRRVLFEPLEPRVLLASNPYINLDGLANNYIGGTGSWIQIPVRVDNLQDTLSPNPDVGLSYATVQLSFSTSASLAPASKNGATVSGNTVTITTQAANNFVVGEAVTVSGVVNNLYDGTFYITAVNGNSFSYVDANAAGQDVSGSGTAVASFFDQGAVQNYAHPDFTNNKPIVIPGQLVPSSGWTFTVGQGLGTLKIVAYSSTPDSDITATDPTNGGTSPDGDILAYVFLHVITGTAAGPATSNIPVTVVDSATSLVEDTDSFNLTQQPKYPTLDPDQNANVTVITDGTAPVAQISVDTSHIGTNGTVGGGDTYTVPVMLTPSVPGGKGITSANADILFDPNYIDPNSISVSPGNLLSSSWSVARGVDRTGHYGALAPSVDTDAITLSAVELNSSITISNIATTSTGSIWILHFVTQPGVLGSSVLNLVPNALPALPSPTNVSDGATNYATYTLSPAPTESLADSVDGVLNFGNGVPTTTTVTSSNSTVAYDTAVTFTANVSTSNAGKPTGSVEFYDENWPAGQQAMGPGVLQTTTASSSTWTLTTGAKTLSATAGDTIEAIYTPGSGSGFSGSNGVTTEVVTALPLTVSGITAANKTYNANTVAVLNTGSAALAGAVSGDTVTLSTSGAVGAFTTKDVGNNIAVTISGLTISGAQASDYTLTQPTTQANISAATLTVSGITANDKVYNANTVVVLNTGGATLNGVYSGDTVTLSTTAAAGTFATKDVGSNIAVAVSGLTIGGAQVGDYTLTQPGTTANITPAALTVSGVTAANKVYNANTVALLNTAGASLVGKYSGDTVTLSTTGAVGTFATKDVGNSIPVTISGLTISGAQSGDYTITQPTASANITPAGLTVSGITAADKVYNANTVASLNTANAALQGVYSGDTVTLDTSAAAGAFATKNVGNNITVAVSGLTISGAQVGDYSLTQPTAKANITPAGLTVSGITATDKVYNANTVAVLNTAGASLVGAYAGDTVTLSTAGAAGTFATKDVGNNITVAVSGLTIGGAQAGDYSLAQPTTTANITPATLTVSGITAADKTYNANTVVVLNTSTASLSGLFGGDAVTLDVSGATAAFATQDVGQHISVPVSGLTISGAQVGDYTLTQPTLTANITPASLTVSGITAADKVYNANLVAVLDTSNAALAGVYSGDTVTLDTSAAAGAFASKNVAQNATVTVSGLTIGGAQSGDYTLAQPTTTANITPAPLTVTATGQDKPADGTTTATVTLSDNHYPGDSLTDTYQAANFSDPSVGNDKTVTVTGIAVSGPDAGNYTLTDTSTTCTADILNAYATTLALTTSNASVAYGTSVIFTAAVTAHGAPSAPGQGSVEFYDNATDLGPGNFVGSAGLTSTWTLATGAKTLNATTGDTITATYTPGGAFAECSGTVTQVVTPLALTVSGITAANKVYNANAVAVLNTAGAALVGVLSGDAVTLSTGSAVGTFATQDVGQNLTVSVSGLTVSGAAVTAGDYTLVQPATTANITPAPLTVTGITASDKVYNANTVAVLNTSGATLVGVQGSDAVTLSTGNAAGTFATKGVGQHLAVSVSGLTVSGAAVTAGDYTLVQPATTANITPAGLTVSGVTAADKVYNANAVAVLHTAGAALVGVFSGDTVTLSTGSAVGTFATKDVGQNIAVSVSGLTIGGAQAGDYTLAQPGATANITPAALTVTGIFAYDKVYNGNTVATFNAGSAALVGVYNGDTVTLDTSSAAGAFATKDVGQNIAVSVSGLALAGAQAGDYTLAQFATKANITPAGLTVSGLTASDKVYNQNTVAVLNTAAASLVGVFSGDTVTLGTSAAAGTFATKNAGQNIAVTVTGLTLGGAQAGDYTLTQPAVTANITQAPLTVTAIGHDKLWDGSTTATVSLSDNHLAGDNVIDSYASASFSDSNVGTNKTVTVTGIAISGSDAGNYALQNLTTTTTADILSPTGPTVIDDSVGSPSFTTTGTWTNWVNQGYDGELDYAPAMSTTVGPASATWAFNVLVPYEFYKVETTWTKNTNRATNAPYTISGGASGVTLPVAVNQQVSPVGVVDGNNWTWQELGVYEASQNGTIDVSLSNGANGYVIADAVRVEPVSSTGPAIMVQAGTGAVNDPAVVPTLTGSQQTVVNFGTSATGGTGATKVFTVSNGGGAALTITNLTVPTGYTLVGSYNPTVAASGGYTQFTLQQNTSKPGTVTGTVTITTNDGSEGSFAFPVTGTVSDIAPTATLSNSSIGGTVYQGSPVSVSFSTPYDPVAADTAAGFRYSFAMTEAGLSKNYPTTGLLTSTSYTFASPGTYTVWGRIIDVNNTYTDYSTQVKITTTALIIDDSAGAPGFTTTGTWTHWTNQGYEGELYSAPKGTAGNFATATWTFTNVTPGQDYAVETTWTKNFNRATNAPFTITGGTLPSGSSAPVTVLVNQQPAPAGVTGDGGTWQVLLPLYQANSSTLTVTLSSLNANAYVIADAVRLQPVSEVAPTATISNNGPVNVGTPVTVSLSNAYDPIPADTNAGFHYSFAVTEAALSKSYATTGTTPNATYNFTTPGTYTVWGRILDVNGGYTDYSTKVTINQPPMMVIDNGANGFSTTGGWTLWTNQGYAGDELTVSAANSTASWTFNNLAAGTYDVYATWPAQSNRTTVAPYTITVNGSTVANLTVNQQIAPSTPIAGSGAAGGTAWWTPLGAAVTVNSNGSTLVVMVSNIGLPAFTLTANNVEADAVMIMDPPTSNAPAKAAPSSSNSAKATDAAIAALTASQEETTSKNTAAASSSPWWLLYGD
jgi:hypothetical protein